MWPSKQKPWTTSDIPDMSGKVCLITGATGGLGFECGLSLATSGATVLLGGRNEIKGQEAVDKIKSISQSAQVSFVFLDNASLSSLEEFAKSFNDRNQPLDILILNAGVMGISPRSETCDGFELQLGTNYLSHFALTARLLPSLRRSVSPRVVHVSSIAAKEGSLHFPDLNFSSTLYDPFVAYSQSKLANLIFALELQRRSDALGWGITSIAAHPGWADTNLIQNGPGTGSVMGWMGYIFRFMMQNEKDGALPLLFAATDAAALGGGYYGPQGLMEVKGRVGEAIIPPAAKDALAASRLWEESERLTNVKWG